VGIRCDTLYSQKLAVTSPTSGGRSVGIVLSRTQATEFVVCYILIFDKEINVTELYVYSLFYISSFMSQVWIVGGRGGDGVPVLDCFRDHPVPQKVEPYSTLCVTSSCLRNTVPCGVLDFSL
jgi:hypothetical protein